MNARPLTLSAVGSVSRVVVLAVVWTAVATLSSQTTAAPSLTMLARDGRRALPIVLVGDQEFIALDDLATAFQLTVREESLGAITVSYKGRTIILTPDQPLASVSGRLISLPAPPTHSGRRWVVPIEFISRALAPVYDVRLDLRKPSRLLVIGDLRVPRVAVRYDPLGAAARLTIDATPRAASTVSQDGSALTIRFDADALDVASPPLALQSDQTLVQAVRLAEPLTLAVDLGSRFGSFKATSQQVDTTMRLVIDLVAMQSDATPQPPAPQPAPAELPPLAPAAPSIHTIAIDPGHGGDDEGVRGGNGAKEKDLTLAVARRAKAAIEARLGIRVLLTRDDDRSLSIDERTAIANNNKADLFLSLHANASMRKATAGASVFTAAFDSGTQQVAPAGGGERVPTFGGGSREVDLVLWDLAQTRHLDASTSFANILAQQLHDRIPLLPAPVDRGPLRVLESANMPAVVIEMGYLTNADQERLLTSDGFQNTFVQALLDAVVRFRDTLPAGPTR